MVMTLLPQEFSTRFLKTNEAMKLGTRNRRERAKTHNLEERI
jgi:hypothetical protein